MLVRPVSRTRSAESVLYSFPTRPRRPFTTCICAVGSIMYALEWAPARDERDAVEVQLWAIACLGFIVGDVVTTGIGLGLLGLAEANPIAVHLFEYSVLGGMVALKLAVCSVGYAAWKFIPHPHCTGVPLGFAVLGVFATAWNLHVIAQAAFL